MIVYKITNNINGKQYIGKTQRSLRTRWQQHCQKDSKCIALKSAIQKYGAKTFTYEVIEEVICPLVLTQKEIEYIKNLNTMAPNGYNLTTGGEGGLMADVVKQKLSVKMTGPGNHQFGKKQSAETKAKRSAALKGRKRPQWVKDKISANHNPKSDLNLTYRRKPNLVPNASGQ